MVDCAPNAFEMDYAQVAAAINKRTKVIIPLIWQVSCAITMLFSNLLN